MAEQEKMNYAEFGELAWQIMDMNIGRENKVSLLVEAMFRLVGHEYDLIGALRQVDALDSESFGKICAFCLSREKVFLDTFRTPPPLQAFGGDVRAPLPEVRAPRPNAHVSLPDARAPLPQIRELETEVARRLAEHEAIYDCNGHKTRDKRERPNDVATNTEKRRRTDNVASETPLDDAFIERPSTKRPLNIVGSFHDGKPCIKCNKIADIFNKRNEKICMPVQHPYGQCPTYCNLCDDSVFCRDVVRHLIYSCKTCNATYSNHPTNKCIKK